MQPSLEREAQPRPWADCLRDRRFAATSHWRILEDVVLQLVERQAGGRALGSLALESMTVTRGRVTWDEAETTESQAIVQLGALVETLLERDARDDREAVPAERDLERLARDAREGDTTWLDLQGFLERLLRARQRLDEHGRAAQHEVRVLQARAKRRARGFVTLVLCLLVACGWLLRNAWRDARASENARSTTETATESFLALAQAVGRHAAGDPNYDSSAIDLDEARKHVDRTREGAIVTPWIETTFNRLERSWNEQRSTARARRTGERRLERLRAQLADLERLAAHPPAWRVALHEAFFRALGILPLERDLDATLAALRAESDLRREFAEALDRWAFALLEQAPERRADASYLVHLAGQIDARPLVEDLRQLLVTEATRSSVDAAARKLQRKGRPLVAYAWLVSLHARAGDATRALAWARRMTNAFSGEALPWLLRAMHARSAEERSWCREILRVLDARVPLGASDLFANLGSLWRLPSSGW